MSNEKILIQKVNNFQFKIPKEFKKEMNVDGIFFADEEMLPKIIEDHSLQQIINVATLPGIVSASLAMPDIHWGYGFPIGGVAAFDLNNGVISPGGVGYDINCGVRMLRSNLTLNDIKNKKENLMQNLFKDVPSGIGKGGNYKLSEKEINKVLLQGAKYVVQEMGLGNKNDLELTEEEGCLKSADYSLVSKTAKNRGYDQLGTLGSGNHFLEVQVVSEIFDEKVADVFGLFLNQIVILVHTGSRGLGYQVCSDYLEVMQSAVKKYEINLYDRQLACAPINSQEGKDYFSAMNAGANFAYANRQLIAHLIRQSFKRTFNLSEEELGLNQIYDIAHNIAKIENHKIKDEKIKLCVHRKGATRGFAADTKEIPLKYKNVGQPIFIPGDMGRYSYILAGTQTAMDLTFGTVCHGAGRVMSRSKAKKSINEKELLAQLKEKDIIVYNAGRGGLTEEAPLAYKDVDKVVNICERAGIAKKVAKVKPVGVIKG